MKRLWALVMALALLAGCAPAPAEGGKTHILCTTYPVYLFTTAVTQGVDEVEVELLVNQQTSCLHDYTLTVEDMRAIERADVIVMNGAGLEDFMADALAQSDAAVIDCSEHIDLLPASDHHHHEGEDEADHEVDPHIWMDPRRAAGMMSFISDQLSERYPACERSFWFNDVSAYDRLGGLRQDIDVAEYQVFVVTGQLSLEGLRTTQLITFHDGFQYFADAFGLTILKSIEEEEGSEASAQELREIIELVREYDIPAIFVEKNGSRRSADVIARETGCKVYELDMIMSGDGQGIEPYIQAMEQNLATIGEALG